MDEIKRPVLVNAGVEKQLDKKALDQVVGGGAVTTTSKTATDPASKALYEACTAGAHFPIISL